MSADKNSLVRVYPMGFIPQVKRNLANFGQQNLGNQTKVSKIVKDLLEELTKVNKGKLPQEQFIRKVKKLAKRVDEGLALTLLENQFIQHDLKTDEELAVIFARISRNSGSFEEISRSVTEEGAAQFHQKWVVSVEGYGHSSVAEHAIVHLAVENIPSLDGDDVTDNRLASFTEFSARFKGRQGKGYFTPKIVSDNKKLNRQWEKVHEQIFAFHDEYFAKAVAYIATPEAVSKHPNRQVKEKVAADQLKNVLPASRLTSMGVTMNARNMEHAITKFLSSPYESERSLGEKIKKASLEAAPTLVKYADTSEYLILTRKGIEETVKQRKWWGEYPESLETRKLVELLDYDPKAEAKFIAAALYAQTETGNLKELMKQAEKLSKDQQEKLIDKLLTLGNFDVPIRALEMVGDYLFEVPGMTYGDWREWKRHRMESYTAKRLSVKYGYMEPPLLLEMDKSADSQFHGGIKALKQLMDEITQLYKSVEKIDPYAAEYCVTRLHYRPALVKMNLREVYHFINLRTSGGAHPFIRRLAWPLFEQVTKVHPKLFKHLRIRLETKKRPAKDFLWSA